jgi:two-component system response regulator AtoC
VLERAVVLCTGDQITLAHLPTDRLGRTLPPPAPAPPPLSGSLARDTPTFRPPPVAPPQLKRGYEADEEQRRQIEDALARCGGNQTAAAKLLGVSRRTLVTRIEQHGIPRPRKTTE